MALNGSRIVFVNKSTFTITCVLVYAYHSHSWSTLSFFRAMTNEWNKTSTNSFHNLLCFTIFHEYYFAIFYSSSTSHLWYCIIFLQSVKIYYSRYLLVQRQQWKHQNIVWNSTMQNSMWNLFKVNDKDTRTTSWLSLCCLFIVSFQQISFNVLALLL